jgi:hypothetical protein
MAARNPVRAVLDVLAGLAFCIYAIPLGFYGLAFAVGMVTSDRRCRDGQWCPTTVQNAVGGVAFGAAVAAAVGLLAIGGIRLIRGERPAIGAWVLGGSGVLLSFGLVYVALAWAGAHGAFS